MGKKLWNLHTLPEPLASVDSGKERGAGSDGNHFQLPSDKMSNINLLLKIVGLGRVLKTTDQ